MGVVQVNLGHSPGHFSRNKCLSFVGEEEVRGREGGKGSGERERGKKRDMEGEGGGGGRGGGREGEGGKGRGREERVCLGLSTA